MPDRRTPRLIRVGEFERIGCKCKHKDCAYNKDCVLNAWQLSGAALIPQLEPEIIKGETPAQVRVYCLNYKQADEPAKEGA